MRKRERDNRKWLMSLLICFVYKDMLQRSEAAENFHVLIFSDIINSCHFFFKLGEKPLKKDTDRRRIRKYLVSYFQLP